MPRFPFAYGCGVFSHFLGAQGDCFLVEVPYKSNVDGQVAEGLVFGGLPRNT